MPYFASAHNCSCWDNCLWCKNVQQRELKTTEFTYFVSLWTLFGLVTDGTQPRNFSHSVNVAAPLGAEDRLCFFSSWMSLRIASSSCCSGGPWLRISDDKCATLRAKVTTWDSKRVNLLLICLQWKLRSNDFHLVQILQYWDWILNFLLL